MALLKLARMGHPALSGPAQPVFDPLTPEIQRLIEDMKETLADSGGVGLAAPQVHVPLRLILFMVPAGRCEEGSPDAIRGGIGVTALINPQIDIVDATPQVEVEGCLSLPGFAGKVPRAQTIRYRGVGADGQPVDVTASGFHARVIQHEVDHLDGILYPMRMSDLTTFGYVEELKKRNQDA